jgi:hypothetical protein
MEELSPFGRPLPPDTFEGGYAELRGSSRYYARVSALAGTPASLFAGRTTNGIIELNSMTPGVM